MCLANPPFHLFESFSHPRRPSSCVCLQQVTSCLGSPRMPLSLPCWQLTSVFLTNSSSNFLALCCFLLISFFFWFMLLEYSATWSNREGQEINTCTLPSLMIMSNGIIFERKSLYNWLTLVNLHILSTTVIHLQWNPAITNLAITKTPL